MKQHDDRGLARSFPRKAIARGRVSPGVNEGRPVMCGWRELYFTQERSGEGFPFGDFGSRRRGHSLADSLRGTYREARRSAMARTRCVSLTWSLCIRRWPRPCGKLPPMARLCFECCRCSWRLVPVLQLTFPGHLAARAEPFPEVKIELLQPIVSIRACKNFSARSRDTTRGNESLFERTHFRDRSRLINHATYLVHRSLPWAAGIGSLLTTPALRPWYASLSKPSWTPPNWLYSRLFGHSCSWRWQSRLGCVEESRLDRRSPATVPTPAIAPQCGLVRGIFSAALSRPGLCRNCNLVVRHPGDIDRILEGGSRSRLVTLAVFDLGQLRGSAQLLDMAIERVITFASTTGILN